MGGLGRDAEQQGITRRELLAVGALAGAGLAAGTAVAVAEAAPVARRTDFGALPAGDGWGAQWCCPGTANLRVAGGRGVLEAGSDVFPNDPRPVAFADPARDPPRRRRRAAVPRVNPRPRHPRPARPRGSWSTRPAAC